MQHIQRIQPNLQPMYAHVMAPFGQTRVIPWCTQASLQLPVGLTQFLPWVLSFVKRGLIHVRKLSSQISLCRPRKRIRDNTLRQHFVA